MSNVCTPSNQIGTYAPSAAGSILFAKNIDCVTLEADLVSAGTLTVDGVDLSNYTDTVEKIQNIESASVGSTNLNGSLTAPQLITSQISALDTITGIEIGSTINQEIATTSSETSVKITNPSLATNNTLGLLLGTSKTTNTTAWQILYVNTNSAGSQSNRLDFRMLGYFNPTLALLQGKVGINTSAPSEALDVTGNAKISGSLTVNGGLVMPGPVIHTMSTWTSSSGSAIKTLIGINASTVRAVKITFQNVGLSQNTTAWLSIPGATIMEGEANSGGATQVSQSSIPMCTANLKNDEALSGEIKLTKVFMSTAKTTWKWIVTGIMYADGGTDGISFNTAFTVAGIVSNATDNLTFNTVQYYAASGTASFNRSGSTSQYDYEY